MTSQFILADDLGVSGNKATLFDQHGKMVVSLYIRTKLFIYRKTG